MNITFYSNVSTIEKINSNLPWLKEHNIRCFRLEDGESLVKEARDTDILVVDAMGNVSKDMIDKLPALKLIQSEGVGYQGIDVNHAKSLGIPVCNNKRVNDTAVAEGALLLMLSCLRNVINGNQGVYDGRQMEIKKASFGVVRELGQCTVGLIGLGDIGKMTAKYCKALGAKVVYFNRTRYPETERELDIKYLDLEELLKVSDIVSLHLAVTPETVNFADKAFFCKMKKDAFLINTARGDLVDNQALLDALLNGEIAGAGLDVIYPEPVEKDNILLDERVKDKLVLTPHIAGITNLTVKKIYANIGRNIKNIINGSKPENRVN